MVITDSQGFTQAVQTADGGRYTVTVPTGVTAIAVNEATLPAGYAQTAGQNPNTVTVAPGANSAGEDGYQPRTDLRIAKTSAPNPVAAGTELTYTLTVDNLGPNPATGITVTEHLPLAGVAYLTHTVSAGLFDSATGIWTVPSLPVSASAQLTIVTHVTAATAVTNTAVVTATTPDWVQANNAVTHTTAVSPTVLTGVVFDALTTK